MEEHQDAIITREIGRSMRFFLNLACLLLIILFSISIPRPLTLENLIFVGIPVVVAVVFFLAFLGLLKDIEENAAKTRDIEMTSKVIGEFNKSWVIRAAVGKIPSFKMEKKPDLAD